MPFLSGQPRAVRDCFLADFARVRCISRTPKDVSAAQARLRSWVPLISLQFLLQGSDIADAALSDQPIRKATVRASRPVCGLRREALTCPVPEARRRFERGFVVRPNV